MLEVTSREKKNKKNNKKTTQNLLTENLKNLLSGQTFSPREECLPAGRTRAAGLAQYQQAPVRLRGGLLTQRTCPWGDGTLREVAYQTTMLT